MVVLAGVLDLWVGDEHYVLREGDAITFPSRLPHWNMNRGDAAASVTLLPDAAELLRGAAAGDRSSRSCNAPAT